MRKWFYAHAGQQHGPVEEAKLVSMFTSGQLQADTPVWTDGLGDWTPARDIENLVPAEMSPPPIPASRTPHVTPVSRSVPPPRPQNENTSPSGFGWYLAVLKKYAVFSGRARRKEYWMFFLFSMIIVFVLGFIEGIMGIAPESDDSILATIYQLAVFLPTLAVGVRRMHDTDRSGWWLIVPIANLVFACTEGTKGDNRFGGDPKAVEL